jgi:hypothetical protein
VFGKSTHTGLYLHAKLEHHPSKEQSALKILIHWARTVCDVKSLEINHLKKTCRKNRYSSPEVYHVHNLKQEPQMHETKLGDIVMIPFHPTVSNKIIRLLAKQNIKTICIPAKKTIKMLRPVKDKLDLKFTGIYCVPCEYGMVCVGQTGRTVEVKCKEHMRHVGLGQGRRNSCGRTQI